MPSLEDSFLRDPAVLWEATGASDREGEALLEDPVEILSCWIMNRQVEALDHNGNPIMLDMQVLLDREASIGSLLWRGALADYAEGEPRLEVKTFAANDDVRGRGVQYRAGLMRHRAEGSV